jgi:[histone H3]-lysine36 N-trimethyltransferase
VSLSRVLPEPEVSGPCLWAPCYLSCQDRFRRKDYAPIEIVQTEKKGFGLRAEQNIKKCVFHRIGTQVAVAYICYRDQFIYEYVGDVVSHPSFMKRMRDYAQEGIKHFYFMMLQKDEVCTPSSSFPTD